MNCPKCSATLAPWPLEDNRIEDEGYAGVQCVPCGLRWWSDATAEKVEVAVREATARVIRESGFPADAELEEDGEDR